MRCRPTLRISAPVSFVALSCQETVGSFSRHARNRRAAQISVLDVEPALSGYTGRRSVPLVLRCRSLSKNLTDAGDAPEGHLQPRDNLGGRCLVLQLHPTENSFVAVSVIRHYRAQ